MALCQGNVIGGMPQKVRKKSSFEDNMMVEITKRPSYYQQHSTADCHDGSYNQDMEKIQNTDVAPQYINSYLQHHLQKLSVTQQAFDAQGLPIRTIKPGSTFFGELDAATGIELVKDLDVSQRWRKLLMVIDSPASEYNLSDLEIAEIERNIMRGSRSGCLLGKLSNLGLRVQQLAVFLEKAQLTSALELLRLPEPIQFTVQPEDTEVEEGATLTLSCKAVGFPYPSYRWFYCQSDGMMVQLDGCCDKILEISDIRKCQAGHYACQAHHGNKSKPVTSQWVTITVAERRVHRAQIVQQPQPKELAIAFLQPLQLKCEAVGYPEPCYQWFRNKIPLEGQNKPLLHILGCKLMDTGQYHCQVWNLPEHAVRSHTVNVQVISTELNAPSHQSPVHRGHTAVPAMPIVLRPNYTAQAKVALLIGTAKYMSAHHPLPAGRNDVLALEAHLRSMDFMVISLVDLKKKEMIFYINWFCLLLNKGVYGVFFYVGHGFDHVGQSFMVPWDASPCYGIEDCLNLDKDVLYPILKCNPSLCLAIIDICRIPCAHIKQDEMPPRVNLPSYGNTCVIHATTPGLSSYEDPETEKGILMTHLSGIIQMDVSVQELHTLLSHAIGKDPILRRQKQYPEIRSNLTKPYGLHNPVDYSGHTKTMDLRVHEWDIAHCLPEAQQWVIKSYNMEVTLTFERVLSNELRMLATVTRFGSVSWAKITVEEVPSTISGFHETDHAQEANGPSKPTRIKFCALQRLQGPLRPMLRIEMCTAGELKPGTCYFDLDWPLVSVLHQSKRVVMPE